MSKEFQFIEHIKNLFNPLVPPDFNGIGDDCAVIPTGGNDSLLISTDMLVEDVHFIRDAISPFELGRKSLAVNLSDLAAMRGVPVGSFLSVSLPSGLDEWSREFVRGYHSLSAESNTPLLGGDTTSSAAGITINVTVVGKSDNIKYRSDAKLGQDICLSGPIGDSGAGLRLILEGERVHPLIDRHNNPRAHIREAQKLKHAGAMMDVSDGVASDLLHILKASGVGAIINVDKLALSDALKDVCDSKGWDATEIALCGGEDYVLLYTIDKGIAHDGYVIGEITAGSTIKYTKQGKEISHNFKGFSHGL